MPFDWDGASIGTKIVVTNEALLKSFHDIGVRGSARTVSEFCYSPRVQPLWKSAHTVKRMDGSVSVTVPTLLDEELSAGPLQRVDLEDEIRESMRVQAQIAKIGASMGFSVWLPKADRGRVLRAWGADAADVLEDLPLGYNSATMKTIEQIDVLWVRRRTIVRAFEVEHTTSIYSGLLRMADLVALQPNIDMRLHIVAPLARRDKVIEELRRPVFALLEKPLRKTCTFLSYDSVRELAELKHLSRMSDKVIEDYEDYEDYEEYDQGAA